MNILSQNEKAFRRAVRKYYTRHQRDFPWRRTKNPYRILVSEIMLQQTQVERVVPKYKVFLRRFPDFDTLASAKLRDVLMVWQGLGYNRRALLLKKLAEIVIRDYKGKLPDERVLLEKLPGVGKGTSGALRAFAFDKSAVFMETNIRRVFIHFFFTKQRSVSDKAIYERIERTLDHQNPREWYWALMDYGAMLGKKGGNPNRKSVSYRRQSRFEGSDRQLRGTIVRLLLQKRSLTKKDFAVYIGKRLTRINRMLRSLEKDGFIVRKNDRCILT